MILLLLQAPSEKRLNLLNGDDVLYIVLDVETTGLDDTSCHVIQLAAKVLGSDDEKDLFSGMYELVLDDASASIFIFISRVETLFRVHTPTCRSHTRENRGAHRNYG